MEKRRKIKKVRHYIPDDDIIDDISSESEDTDSAPSSDDENTADNNCLFNRKDIEQRLTDLDELLNRLSKSTIQLQQEISLLGECRQFNPVSSSKRCRDSTLPIGGISLTLNQDSVTIPIMDKCAVRKLDEMLCNREIRSNLLNHLKTFFGTKKQRDPIGALRKLVRALISPECLSNFTWTGKTKSGQKEVFKNFKKIHEILIETLCYTDESYDFDSYHYAIVNHVLKYAYYGETKKRKIDLN